VLKYNYEQPEGEKFMKKLIILLLIAALSFAACGNEGTSPQIDPGDIKDLLTSPDIPDIPDVPPLENEPAPLPENTQTGSYSVGDILTYIDGTDAGDWFIDDGAMQHGAREAYELTGVKFGIFVTDNVGEPTDAELHETTEMLYDEFFGDSTEHLMLFVVDLGNGEFAAWHIAGSQARLMFAEHIMLSFYEEFSYYWYLPDRYTESEMFGLALSQTARWIAARAPAVPAIITSGTHKNENMSVVTPLSEIGKFSVFWGNTGDRVHISPECRTFQNGVLYGTLNEARNAGRHEWCGTCSSAYRGDDGYGGDAEFLREGNPNVN
jgi:hypothetical protein